MGEVSLEVGFMIALIVLISFASVVFLYPLTSQKSTILIFARQPSAGEVLETRLQRVLSGEQRLFVFILDDLLACRSHT